MYIDTGTIITAGAVLAALTAILTLVFKVYRWVLRQDRQDREIQRLKDDGVSACLDGLIQLGANHAVPIAKDKLDKYLNQSAHK